MQSRRDFVKSALSMALAAGPLQMLQAGPVAAADTSGYRALVCVFLFGDMDSHDTVLPVDAASYNSYSQIRETLLDAYAALPGSGRERASLLELDPLTRSFGSRRFGLPPELSGMHSLFSQGRAAIVGNVGPLLQPMNRDMLLGGTAPLPARLFSHNDQQSTWMSFAPEGAQFGWGGLFSDAIMQSGGNSQGIFSQVSLGGNVVFLAGNQVAPYEISPDGVPSIALIDAAGDRVSEAARGAMREHFAGGTATPPNLFERDFVNLSRTSLNANDTLASALASGQGLATPFPQSSLGAQLRTVAETIAVRGELGVGRQIFFVAQGGFDTHSAQATALPALQRDLGDAIAAFYAATEELGVAQSVTTFTAADFGRTLTVNGDGTDHGWGAHHFVVGGSVRGGDIYGDIPVSELGHAQDAGNGRLIPQVSVEQFAAPLGRWFGLGESELATALPALARFPSPPLGFI